MSLGDLEPIRNNNHSNTSLRLRLAKSLFPPAPVRGAGRVKIRQRKLGILEFGFLQHQYI